VTVVVFHDENANGRLDASESSRIPEVEVSIGGRTARTEVGTGRAVVMAPAGAQSVTVGAGSLPAFFVAPSPTPVQVPATADVQVPLALPIGDNRVRTYLCWGDSITIGIGSSNGSGYRAQLESRLRAHFGGATLISNSRDGQITERGARFIEEALNRLDPAYTLLMLGTNDWHLPQCQDTVPCETVDNIRRMLRSIRGKRSLPVLATIPPVNPAINADRNIWVSGINDLLRPIAAQEGAVVADVYAAFQRAGNLPSLFVDQVHPNDAGYDVIAGAFFEAITHGRIGGTSADFSTFETTLAEPAASSLTLFEGPRPTSRAPRDGSGRAAPHDRR
jgi:lysophospholipase L1-like esterase